MNNVFRTLGSTKHLYDKRLTYALRSNNVKFNQTFIQPNPNVPETFFVSWVMSSLPASMKRIRSKTDEKKWQHCFPLYKTMVVFLRRSREDNFIVHGPIWPKFELLLDIMHVLHTDKSKMDQINSNQEKVATSFWTLKGS